MTVLNNFECKLIFFLGLKLIVKLCGDQGLSETNAWTKELQRAQARIKQQERGMRKNHEHSMKSLIIS